MPKGVLLNKRPGVCAAHPVSHHPGARGWPAPLHCALWQSASQPWALCSGIHGKINGETKRKIDIFLLAGNQLPYCGPWRRETEGGPHTSPYQVSKCVEKGDCKIDSQLAFQGNDGPVCVGLDQWMESPWPPSQPKAWSVSASVLRLLQVQCNPKFSTDQNVTRRTCTLQATSWVCATGSTWVPSCINRPSLPSWGTCHCCRLASYHLRLQVTLTYS